MGHPPENYSPNSVVAHGDILKYYRHVDIPLLDAILYFRRGLNGFKQVCSAADLGDKPSSVRNCAVPTPRRWIRRCSTGPRSKRWCAA